MARKPNYQFERMERDRQKAAKAAQKAAAKQGERAAEQPEPPAADEDEAET
jgi:hypothetical protein